MPDNDIKQEVSSASGCKTVRRLQLFDLARKARQKAYAPYSCLSVGVALRTKSGALFSGCNIENASFPEGWCAETATISAMILAAETDDDRIIEELLVIADHSPPITPCGGCRQRIREFGVPETIIHAADLDGIQQSYTLSELLPAAFDLPVEDVS